VSLFEFQEPINCSNITSLAYALSALGYPTTVDEVIYNSGTPVRDVTDLGVGPGLEWTRVPVCMHLPTENTVHLFEQG
jgi:hypothetical protein